LPDISLHSAIYIGLQRCNYDFDEDGAVTVLLMMTMMMHDGDGAGAVQRRGCCVMQLW
jgi:hypothetical protein